LVTKRFCSGFSEVWTKGINASLIILLSMPYLDIAMPTALFIVVAVAVLLNKRVEEKLKSTIEEKELKSRDVILLVVFMSIIVSVVAYTSYVNPGAVFQNILLIVFLSSYTMLLFTFSYVFSNITRARAQLISVGFGVASLIAGSVCLLDPLQDSFTVFRVAVFFGLALFCFAAIVYERGKTTSKAKWYVAVQPAAMFVLLFVFFNFIHNTGTLQVWTPYLMDVFGLTFAILIILYLSSMFSWKTVGLFAVLLTTMDIILVIGTGTMVQAANQFTGLGLPVLVYLPNVPIIVSQLGISFRGLGLGDFFFAGVLAVQTFNKFGKKTAFVAIATMAAAFGIWEAFLPDILNWLKPIVGRDIGGFPGTLMIISGWAPIIAWKLLSERNKVANQVPPQQDFSLDNAPLDKKP
jgi:hypothetical protein